MQAADFFGNDSALLLLTGELARRLLQHADASHAWTALFGIATAALPVVTSFRCLRTVLGNLDAWRFAGEMTLLRALWSLPGVLIDCALVISQATYLFKCRSWRSLPRQPWPVWRRVCAPLAILSSVLHRAPLSAVRPFLQRRDLITNTNSHFI